MRIPTTIEKKHLFLVSIYLLWLYIVYICLSAAFSNMMSLTQSYSDGKYYLLFDALCVGFVLLHRMPQRNAIQSSAFLVLLMQIAGMVIGGTNSLFVIMIRTISWYLAFYMLYTYFTRYPEDKMLFTRVASIGIIVLSFYTYTHISQVRASLNVDAGMNELYLILLSVPFLLMTDRILIKSIGLMAVFILVVVSLKGTALLALIAGLVVYILIYNRITGRKNSVWLVFGLVIGLVAYLFLPQIILLITNILHVNWDAKLVLVASSEGSDRIPIWTEALRVQGESNIIQWLFGHGYNQLASNLLYRGGHFSAHNDFIETLFDFGLVGLTFYLGLYKTLLKELRVSLIEMNPYAPALGMSVMMFFVVSMFSHLLIVPGLLVNCAMVWAICSAPHNQQVYTVR